MENGRSIAARTLIQAGTYAGVILAVLLVLKAAQVFLVVFGGVLFAILFHGIAQWVSRKTAMPEKWSLFLSLTAILVLSGIGMWLIAPDVSDQASELADRIPRALRQLRENLLQYEWVNRLMQQQDRIRSMLPDGSNAVGVAAGFFSSTFGALGNLLIALALGLFISINPAIYINGLLYLVPPTKRARAHEVLQATGNTLASWLIAKLVEMLVIGVLTTLGLWLLGIDLALVLGVIAALLSFIPNIGPVVALLPAALIALISGPDTLIYVVLLYTGIQTFESYVLTPFLQQRLVDLPPALVVSVQVLFGVLAGVLGVILATPLTAAAMVMIRMWYVEDLLGDQSVNNA